ncbi:MAG: macro domain-containing protein [Deltaproteobacteria bacterium]|nr:macro domain-containing protein [Deltaproteobacteria bacterium]
MCPLFVSPAGEEDLLADCYRSCYQLAREYNILSIAFPAVSTGVYGFPKQRAARITVRETLDELGRNRTLQKVLFVCFNDDTRTAYEEALQQD